MTTAERLYSRPWEFEFFEAVRLLELLNPDRTPVGEGPDPEREAVRLRSEIGFLFPAAEVQAIEKGSAGEAPVMSVNLLPVGGAEGPLPDADSERIVEQNYRGNKAFGAFLDLFHHRLLSILVRLRKAVHPSYTSGLPHEGPIARFLYAFVGLGIPELRNRLLTADRSFLFYSGLVVRHPRSADGLERFLADYFGAPVRVAQFRGQWRALEGSQQTVLGRSGRNRELGEGAMLGTRVWDQQGRFEVVFGPLDSALFHSLLPRGSGFEPLCELTRYYVGPDHEFSFQLILRATDVPAARLGASWLGWTSWIKTRPFARDASQVRLRSRRPADPFATLDLASVVRH